LSDLSSVLAPRWNNVCSKIQPGECAWFHTSLDESSSWFLQAGTYEASYAADWAGTEGSFDWPELHGFAYHVCRTTGGSADCKADGDLQLHKLCASHSSVGDGAALAVQDLEHRYSYQGGTGRWDMLYQGKILEQESVCRDVSTSLHADKSNGQIGINVKLLSDLSSVLAPRWNNVCSKIQPGECAWFHTSLDESSLWFLQAGTSEASYAADWASTAGSFKWPELQGFAYHVCRSSSSSSDCKTDGDLQLTKLCASHSSIGDNVDLSVEDLEHRYSYQGGTGRWDMLYQGHIVNVFRIASVNTHLFKDSIPGKIKPISVYMDEERQESIFGYVEEGNYDFLGFTEVWADTRRETWKSKLSLLGYSDALAPSGPTIEDPTSIITDETIIGSSGMIYADKGDTLRSCFQWYEDMTYPDNLAFKGVVYGASTVRDTTFGWLLTHAQASYTETKDTDDDARIRQIKETLIPAAKTVVKWMDDNKDPLQGPTILLGDLNIIGDTTAEYNNFKTTMAEIGFVDCWLQSSGTSTQDGYTYDYTRNNLVKHFDPAQSARQRLDYIFLHPGESGAKCQDFRIGDNWKTDGGTNVSDHDPVEVVIKGVRDGAKVKSSHSTMPCPFQMVDPVDIIGDGVEILEDTVDSIWDSLCFWC